MKNKPFVSSAVWILLQRYLFAFTKRSSKNSNTSTTGTIIPILGVSLGVFAFTVVLSVMSGFVTNLKNRLLVLEPHIEVVAIKGFNNIPEDINLISKIKTLSSDIQSVTPFQKMDAILQSQNRASDITLLGVDPNFMPKNSPLEKSILSQNLNILSKEVPSRDFVSSTTFPPVIIGRDLMRQMLRLEVGDRVTLVSATPEEGPGGLIPKQIPVVIADTLATQNSIVDSKWIIAPLKIVQDLSNTQQEWSGLQVQIKNPMDVEHVVKKINPLLSPLGLRAKPWTEANKALLRALSLERWGMSFVLYMVILVGCFSITITLVLAAKRKCREMAILRALGLERWELGILYLLQGIAIGAIGVGIGVGGGVLFLNFLNHHPIPFIAPLVAGKPLTIIVDWQEVFMVSLSSICLAGIAALWPALEVMSINVVETITGRD